MKKAFQALACMLVASINLATAQEQLAPVKVTAERTTAEKYQMPNTVESTNREKIAETVNIIDTPDALKYMPSLMARKRDSADFGGATLATRIWGVSYSAKSIILVDGMPISTQLYNDNNFGPPKWFVVSPEEIDRIDVMYGPYSAAYAGNSMGAIVDISTKRPTKAFEASASLTQAFQTYQKFGTNETYQTQQLAGLIGGRNNAMSWRLMLNHQDANTQPRSFGTTTTAGLSPYPFINKTATGATTYYSGANGILHGVSDNLNLKLAFDLTSTTQLTLSSGIFMGTTDAKAQSYMSNGSFCTTTNCSGTGGTTLASGVYGLGQEQYVHGLGLKSNTKDTWDYELGVSNVYYHKDLQRTAGYLNSDGSPVNGVTAKPGTVRDMSGSGWTNLDAKAIYRPDGVGGKHEISFGYHQDFNKLSNSTQDVVQWQSNNAGTMNVVANGNTETKAWWLQNAWRANDNLQLIFGGRYESWETRGGMVYNKSASTSTNASALSQPSVSDNHFSPKFSALMGLQDGSTLSLSVGNAYRFPTVGELYNIASCTSSMGCTTTKYVSPSPSLIKPENVNSAELALATQGANSNHRASLFVEHVRDALISQFGALDASQPTELYSYWKNVAEVKSFGIELSSNVRKFLFDQFDLFSSLTWVESVITANEGTTSLGRSVVGNRTPGVSPLRVKFVGTYRPSDKTSISVGGNYQQQFYSSIDNNDVNPNTYQGFSGFFVMDLKVRHKLDKNWVASAGIDNIGNQDYFLFHPFPQRTFVANLKYLH